MGSADSLNYAEISLLAFRHSQGTEVEPLGQ